jgi:arylsulfatase A-like enzyme
VLSSNDHPALRRRVLVVVTVLALTAGLLWVVYPRLGVPATSREPMLDSPAVAPVTAPQDERPNIVLISSDDQRLDEMRFLPQVTELIGEQGLTFDEAITPHPLCCPARAELMTGQFAQNNGVRTNFPPQGGYESFDAAGHVGVYLSNAGYNTAFLGKHLNGYSKNAQRDPGWTHFNATSHGHADYVRFKQWNEDGIEDVKGHYTDYLAREAVDDVRTLSGYDAPFFLWVSHFAPHPARRRDTCGQSTCGKEPPRLSPRYQRMQQDTGELPQEAEIQEMTREVLSNPAFNEADVSDKQNLVRRQGTVSRQDVREAIRGRAGALASLDDAVVDLVTELDRLGELDNTYLVFVTDNGFQLGEHRWFGKTLPYEENLRTPMLVRGPGIEAGTRSDAPATLVDLVPTFLDIAGAEERSNRPVDGTSLLPLWRGEDLGPLHPGGVLIQGGPQKSETGLTGWLYRGVRTERYTCARFHDGFVELYDRERDPHQVESVAGDPAYAEVEAELARRTDLLSGCSGPLECSPDLGPVPDPVDRSTDGSTGGSTGGRR